MNLKEKIGQLFMIGFRGTEVPAEAREFILSNGIGAIILFARNIESISQVKTLTGDLHSLGKIPPFIFTDQEGGTVVQFKELAATAVSAMGLAATGDFRCARSAGAIIGSEMKAVGIDCVIAPVLDVNYEEDNPIIGIRSFSDEPQRVIEFASAFALGLNDSGVAACGKHYPGHGGTTADSHLEIPSVSITQEYFSHYCYSPFAALAKKGIDAMMSSHVVFPGISESIATFCPHLIGQLLREKAGYNGVVISDCMEMKAVKDNFTPEEIAKGAIEAGIDLIIASHTPEFQQELLDALHFYVKNGTISEKRIDESVARVLKLKEAYPYRELGEDNFISNQMAVGIELESSAKERPNLEREQEIADKSVTLLRNNSSLIPMPPKSRVLIVEWKKVKATMSVSEAENVSMLVSTAKRYFDNVEVIILELGGGSLAELETYLQDNEPFDTVIAGLYSRNPRVERLQGEDVKGLLKLHDRVIVAALGNPYDIRHFPAIDTYIATYGFRGVQLEALFKVLTGQITPTGRLPVQIKGVFPRDYAAGV